MLPSFASQTVTVRRAPLVADAHGGYRDWSVATPSTLTGCLVQPVSSSEEATNRDGVVADARMHAPAGTDVLSSDRLVVDGAEYEVIGEPLRWPSPTGALAHVEVLLRRVEG